MTRWKNLYLDNHIHFFTASVARRIPLFSSKDMCRILLEIWDCYRSQLGFAILGYVIMPDHFHLMTHFDKGEACGRFHRNANHLMASCAIDLLKADVRKAQWLRSFAMAATGTAKHRVFAEHPRSLPVTDRITADQKLNYMHMNPVRAGLVDDPCDWPWSSAGSYLGDERGALRVDLESFPMLD